MLSAISADSKFSICDRRTLTVFGAGFPSPERTANGFCAPEIKVRRPGQFYFLRTRRVRGEQKLLDNLTPALILRDASKYETTRGEPNPAACLDLLCPRGKGGGGGGGANAGLSVGAVPRNGKTWMRQAFFRQLSANGQHTPKLR